MPITNLEKTLQTPTLESAVRSDAQSASPLEWLLGHPKRAPLHRGVELQSDPQATERILSRLVQQEAHEPLVYLKDDYRQAFITLTLAAHGNTMPFVVASYQIYGLHPEKVWPAILARRSALLGPESWAEEVRAREGEGLQGYTTKRRRVPSLTSAQSYLVAQDTNQPKISAHSAEPGETETHRPGDNAVSPAPYKKTCPIHRERRKGCGMSTALESQLDDLIKLTTERMAEHQQMLAAIRAWHEWWNDSYDGEPLRDHEVKMLAVLAKFVDDMEVPHA